jgi:hypothetical protein
LRGERLGDYLKSMRTLTFLALGSLLGACGGKLAAADEDGGSVESPPPVVDAGEGMDATSLDSSAPPVSEAAPEAAPNIACVPSETNLPCPPPGYCVMWVATDAAPPTVVSASFSSDFPDAEIVSWFCGSGSVLTACAGGPPFAIAWDVSRNDTAWVVCQEP